MFFYVCFVFYTQLLVLMLQYHISTTKHSTVPLFIRYVLLCVCCILHTFTSTNVTISHINNQAFYHSLVYTLCIFMCLLYYTHKHSTIPLFILYVLFLFDVFYTHSFVLMLLYHISTTKHSTVPVFIRYVLLCVCCILHKITSTISHINNQTFYRSLVYTVCSFMSVLYFTHNYLY
jgi:hypothetical protein